MTQETAEQSPKVAVVPEKPQPEHKGDNSTPSNERAVVGEAEARTGSTHRQVDGGRKQHRTFCNPFLMLLSTLGSLFAGMISLSATAGQGMSKFYWHIPILYGDKSTREWPEITGFRSGCAAGGKSLFYGFYDGVTGVITLPYKGAKGAGLKGLGIGILHGVGGLLFKPLSGFWGFIGHPIFGFHKHISDRRNGRQQQDPSMVV